MKPFFASLLAVLLPLSALAQNVKVDFDRDTDFSRYKTFAWSPTHTPDMIEEQIRAFVKKSFADFPPKPSP